MQTTPLRILLIAEDPIERDKIIRALSKQGHMPTWCHASDLYMMSRLDYFRRTRNDLVISAVCSPGRTGLGVLAALQLFDSLPPVIQILHTVTAESRAQADSLGGTFVLQAPVEMALLQRAVEQVATRRDHRCDSDVVPLTLASSR